MLCSGAVGLVACARSRYIDVLAPPSSVRPSILQMFERRTGIQVRASAWVSPTDALGKVLSSAARADLVVAIVDLFEPLIPDAVARGLLCPLQQSRLPQPAQLSAVFREDMCFGGHELYMLPVYWGYTSVLYNTAAIPASDPLVDSWGLLFEDRFAGRVALRDDPHESLATAALYLGHRQPHLMDRADLDEVKRFLIAKKRNFRALWSNLAEAVQLMATREVDAIYGQPVHAQTLKLQGTAARMNTPREGLLLFVQGALIPRNARHASFANEWLEFLLEPGVSVKLAEEAAVLSPLESVRRASVAAPQAGPGYGALSSGVPLVRLRRPANLQEWIEAWAEFKAA